jgi:hypothetical protein
MPSYLVEMYAGGLDRGALAALLDRTASVTREVGVHGRQVRIVRCVLVPDEDTCFIAFDATSEEAVQQVALRAGLLSAELGGSVKRSVTIEQEKP